MRAVLGACALASSFALVPAGWAQQGTASGAPASGAQDDRRYDQALLERERAFSSDLMSPFCPGRTMVNCPSERAHAYREQFKRYLAQGVSEETLRERFLAQFGEVVRSTPRHPLAAWVLPLGILLAGAGLVAYALIRLRRREAAQPSGPVEVTRETEAALERELKRRGL